MATIDTEQLYPKATAAAAGNRIRSSDSVVNHWRPDPSPAEEGEEEEEVGEKEEDAGANQQPAVPDCSLNGEKNAAGVCVCDKPWSGPVCSTMNFKPVTFPQGYGMAPNLTSWGGNTIQDPATGKFHIFVSAMTNGCPLSTWGQNSRIEHGVADDVTGPYKMVDVAIPTWSHNSAPIALKDGTFANIHIGTGSGPANGGKNCTPGPPPPPAPCSPGSTLEGWKCEAHVCAGDGGVTPGNCGDDLGEPSLNCTKGDVVGCSEAAAKECLAHPQCTAFGLSNAWSGMQKAKLFASSRQLTTNRDWNVWTKTASAAGPQERTGVHAAGSTLWEGSNAIVDHGMVVGMMSDSSSSSSSSSSLAAAGSTIHIAKSLDGPWTPLSPNTLGGCNNPAPWVHRNGTIYCLCGNAVLRTNSISGPWEHISSLSHSGGPAGNYEDPFLYNDERGWHLLYHVYSTTENPPHGHECVNATVSAHAFSVDGFTWHMSPLSPYGTQVQLTSGGVMTVATRERPKLWFNATGHKTHLFNGVCGAANCPNGPQTGCVDCKYANWDFTLVQPLDL